MPNDIKLIIFDLDGTLYSKTDAYYEADYRALAHVVHEIKPEISEEKAYTLAKESKRKYGKTYDLFLQEEGIPFEELDRKFLTHLTNTVPQFLTKSEELKLNFQRIKNAGIKIALYTHNQKDFIEKALEMLGIKEFFEDENIFCKGKMRQKKNLGIETFEAIAQQFSVDYKDIIMVDDEDIKLVFPKQLGMKTVLITEQDLFSKRKDPDLSPDREYENISEFFRNLGLAKANCQIGL